MWCLSNRLTSRDVLGHLIRPSTLLVLNRFRGMPVAPAAVFVHAIGENRPAVRREMDARFGIAGSGQ